MEPVDKFVAGVVAVALVTAFGLHAVNLATLTKQVGTSSSQVLGTAETGNASGNA
jgi:hypothetical protein